MRFVSMRFTQAGYVPSAAPLNNSMLLGNDKGDPTADDLTQLAAAQWEEHLQKWLGVEKRSIHVLYSGADAAAVEVRKDI